VRAGWQSKTLGEVCEVVNGGTPKTSVANYWGGDHLWITPAEMGKRSSPYVSDTERKLTDLGLADSSARLLPPLSVILSSRAPIGHLIINTEAMATNQGCKGLVPGKSIDHKFLFYYLGSIVDILNDLGTGATFKELSGGKVKEVPVPVPPFPEQKRIVAILDEAFEGISAAVAKTEKNLANARELFESYLNSVFTPQKGDGWVERKLGDVCENLDSKRIPVTKSKRNSGDVPYYGASGIVDHVADYLFDEDLLLVSEDGANLLARTYPIAFSITGKAWVNNHAHVLRFEAITSQRFIEYYLNSIPLNDYVSGMAQPKLNQKSLNSICVPFPPLPEQMRVVEGLEVLSSETQRLETIYQQKLANFAELKQSILQKAFAGELTGQPKQSLQEAVA
jgi:type I restriction enzyme, S subunit